MISRLFTDRKGVVRKHVQRHVRIETILASFLIESNASRLTSVPAELLDFKYTDKPGDPELLPAVFIIGSEYRILTRTQFTTAVLGRKINTETAIQQFRYSHGDPGSKILAHFSFSASPQTMKTERVRLVQGKILIEGVFSGQIFCAEMKRMGLEAKMAMERNGNVRVLTLSLLFLIDCNRKVWLMGSTDCKVIGQKSVPQAIPTPVPGTSSPYHLVSHTRSVSSFNSTQRRSMTPSLVPNKKTGCSGDFCNFVISQMQQLRKQGVDYDDLIAKIRMTYDSEKVAESNQFKLTMAADYLQKEKEKLHNIRVTKDVSYKSILIGKQLLSRAAFNGQVPGLLEIDLADLAQGGMTKEDEEAAKEISVAAATQPQRFYQTVKVCERCYLIYSHINRIYGNQRKISPGQTTRTPMLSSYPSTRTVSRSPTPCSTSRKQPDLNYYLSPLGRLRKDNLNDLLADVRFALAETEDRQAASKPRMVAMYRSQTEEEVKKKRLNEEKRRASTIRTAFNPKAVERDNLEDLATKFFPTENTKTLQDQDKAARDERNYKDFLTKRRRAGN